jgi:hypothetical protein
MESAYGLWRNQLTGPFQNLLNPAAYLRHTYAYVTTIAHPFRMPKPVLRVSCLMSFDTESYRALDQVGYQVVGVSLQTE